MEARVKYHTFGRALEKLLSDPAHIVITREKYLKEGAVIMEALPDFSKFDDLNRPTLLYKKGDDYKVFRPTQEDIHSMNWMCLRVPSPEEELPLPDFEEEEDIAMANEDVYFYAILRVVI